LEAWTDIQRSTLTKIAFLQKLISKSSDSYFQYQEHNIRGSFELEHGDEDNNCQLVKYQAFTGNDFNHLLMDYCDIWKKTDEETRAKDALKALKGAKADPYKIITIPGLPKETITKTYVEFKQMLDKKSEEANKEKEGEEVKGKEKEGEEGKGKEGEEGKGKGKEGEEGKGKEGEEGKGKEGEEGKDKEGEKVKWYKSGWFIALIVIFIVLVITGIVLAGLMVSNKDKTLDYTS